jgi:hypothetical protein
MTTCINYMEQSPSSEGDSRSTNQEIPHLLWNLKAHYGVQKRVSYRHDTGRPRLWMLGTDMYAKC